MKVLKKIFVLTIALLLIFVISEKNIFSYDMMKDINSYASGSAPGAASSAVKSVTTLAQAAVTIARVVAAGVAIIMLSVLAMKYMSAAPSEKADIKKHAVPYVVGAIIMFSVSGILGILQKFAKVFEDEV